MTEPPDRAKRLRDLRAQYGNNHPYTQAALRERVAEVLTEEAEHPEPGLWWLSFVGDEGFRGVAIIEAEGGTSAVGRASELGLNPGGEVAMLGPYPLDTPTPQGWPLCEACDRLMGRDELTEKGLLP